MELYEYSAIELALLIRQKKCSVREVVTAYLRRIEVVNPKINAIVVLRAEQALCEANELDTALAHNEIKGPLHGVPFTLKDIFNTKGDIVTAGTLGLKNHVAKSDAIVAKRLKQAGGILIGKTNTPELECGSDTDNLVYGRTTNPYKEGYSAGGSSGGGGAIIAAGGSAFDVGSDIGGSVRIPASHCGITSIRPTVGRVPGTGLLYGQREGLLSLIFTEGPLARKVADLELILNLISGPDGVDPRAIPMPLLASHDVNLSQARVAFFYDNNIVDINSDVKRAVKNAANVFNRKNYKVTEVMPPCFETGYKLFRELNAPIFLYTFQELLTRFKTEKLSVLMEQTIDFLEKTNVDLKTFSRHWVKWDRYRSDMLQFMQAFDVLICPVMPFAPSQKNWDNTLFPKLAYAWAITMALLPSAVVRAGTSDEGIPIGVQVVANPWREDVALAAAKIIEHANLR